MRSENIFFNLDQLEVMVFSRRRQPLMVDEMRQEIRFYNKNDYHRNGDTYGAQEWYEITDKQHELETGHFTVIEYIMMRMTYDENFLTKYSKIIK